MPQASQRQDKAKQDKARQGKVINAIGESGSVQVTVVNIGGARRQIRDGIDNYGLASVKLVKAKGITPSSNVK